MRAIMLAILALCLAVTAAGAGPPEGSDAAADRLRSGPRTIDCDTTYTYSWDMFRSFEMVANGSGPITRIVGFDVTDPPAGYGAYSTDWYRDVMLGGGSVLSLPGGMQDAGGWYFIVAGPSTIVDYEAASGRWTRQGNRSNRLRGNSYEIRFTNEQSYGFAAYTTSEIMPLPFAVWSLRSTPSDPADDVRMVPFLYDWNENEIFDLALDHEASEGYNDPYSDWIYLNMPPDSTPGDAGYDQFVQEAMQGVYTAGDAVEHMARVSLMNWDRHQGESGPGQGDGPEGALPEAGTIFRINCRSDLGPPVDTLITCRTVIDANHWRMALWPDGLWGYALPAAGGEWPKGSGQTLIYSAGHYVGGTKYGSPSVSQIEYSSEYQPGDILNDDPAPIDQLLASDPLDPANRVYVIDTTRAGPDWDEWPVGKGAPTDPAGDPLLISAQDSWTVFNDLEETRHEGTPMPVLGLEVQRRTFMFTQESGVRDAVLVQWHLRNMSDIVYPEAYFGVWMDPDLVVAGNDLAGVDLLRSMAFVYNGDAEDAPIALGVDLLLGPEGDNGEPLPLTSFTRTINGTDPSTDLERLNYLRGLARDGSPRPNGPFDYPGDPVTGTGLLDSNPADRRILLASGPFRLEPGQTKDVIAAVVAAQGADRIDAIVQLRQADDHVQSFFDLNWPTAAAEWPALTDPDPIALSPCWPNPFDPSQGKTSARYRLTADSKVRFEVLDIQGRVVRAWSEEGSAGEHVTTWDGRDRAGHPVASGIYTLRLQAGHGEWRTRRVVALR